MNRVVILLLLLSTAAAATQPQHKTKHPAKHPSRPAAKQSTKRPPTHKTKPAAPEAKGATTLPFVGSQITLVTKDGKRTTGQVIDISDGAIQVKSDSGQAIIPLESLASISFGPTGVPAAGTAPATSRHPNFTRDVESVLSSFQEIEKAIEGGADYTDYGRQLTGLRRVAEHFVNKYAGSDDEVESRATALLSAALTDYTWARTVWTLKLGRTATTTLTASDSPVVADALDLYPDLRAQAGTTGIAADKLIGGLWKKAVADVDRTRKLVSDEAGRK